MTPIITPETRLRIRNEVRAELDTMRDINNARTIARIQAEITDAHRASAGQRLNNWLLALARRRAGRVRP